MYPIRVYIYELQDQVTLIFGARSQNSGYLYEEGSFDWECQDELPGNAVSGGHMDADLGKNLSNCTLVEFCDVYYTSIKCFLHGLGLHRRRKQRQAFLFTSCFLVSQLYTPFTSPLEVLEILSFFPSRLVIIYSTTHFIYPLLSTIFMRVSTLGILSSGTSSGGLCL